MVNLPLQQLLCYITIIISVNIETSQYFLMNGIKFTQMRGRMLRIEEKSTVRLKFHDKGSNYGI